MKKWFRLQIFTTREREEQICDYLYQFNISGIQINDYRDIENYEKEKPSWVVLDRSDFIFHEDIVLETYLEYSDRESNSIRQIEKYLSSLDKTTYEIHYLENEDWANEWKKYYQPIEVGEKLLVVPSWIDVSESGRKIIQMDPGMAFGTGQHETTVLCMELLEELEIQNKKVLDIGCGSGILSLTAATLGAAHVTAIDIDELAIDATNMNVRKNNYENIVDAKIGNLTKGLQVEQFDIVLANILFSIIQNLIPELPRYSTKDSYFIFSGILQEQEKQICKNLASIGLHIVNRKQRKDWVALLAAYQHV